MKNSVRHGFFAGVCADGSSNGGGRFAGGQAVADFSVPEISESFK